MFLPKHVEKLREHLRNFLGLSMGETSSNTSKREFCRRKIIKIFLIQRKMHENIFWGSHKKSRGGNVTFCGPKKSAEEKHMFETVLI